MFPDYPCSPRKCLEIRCSEVASEEILGQKQSSSSSVRYMARGVLYPVFGLSVAQHLTFHVFIRATNNTDLFNGG